MRRFFGMGLKEILLMLVFCSQLRVQDGAGSRSSALPKGYLWADERIKGICASIGL